MSKINFRMIKQLWMYLSVAEELHFGRAATRLGISQPSLTEQIKILEYTLKIHLFERSRRGTQLTPAGLALLPSVQHFMHQVNTLENTVHEIIDGKTGILQIGAITASMLETIPPLLDMLASQYPDITVYVKEIDSSEAIHALQTGELDVAFVRLDEATKSGIETKILSKDALGVALPLDHKLSSNSSPISISELKSEKFVMSSRRVSPVYFDMLVSICRKHGFSPLIHHEVKSIASQIAYVGCGQGIALVPMGVAVLTPKNVTIKPIIENITIITSAMVWNTQRHNPIVSLVKEFYATQPKLVSLD
jgi:DNA-binding transcriptional LysR family regulator